MIKKVCQTCNKIYMMEDPYRKEKDAYGNEAIHVECITNDECEYCLGIRKDEPKKIPSVKEVVENPNAIKGDIINAVQSKDEETGPEPNGTMEGTVEPKPRTEPKPKPTSTRGRSKKGKQ